MSIFNAGELPLFPLHTVLFPDGLLPLRIFEQRYLEMAKSCLRNDAPFGVCLIKDGAEVGAPASHEAIGCVARIVQWDMQQLGVLQVVVQGASRFRVDSETVLASGLIVGQVAALDDDDSPLPAGLDPCLRLLERIVAEHGEGLFAKPHRFDSGAWIGARLAEVLPLPNETKQKLLEMGSASRLAALHRLIARQA